MGLKITEQARIPPSPGSCDKGRQVIRLRAICFLCFQGQIGNNKCKQTKAWSCLLSQQQIKQFAIICFRCRGNFLQSRQKHQMTTLASPKPTNQNWHTRKAVSIITSNSLRSSFRKMKTLTISKKRLCNNSTGLATALNTQGLSM